MTESKHSLQLGKIMLRNYRTYKGDTTIELSRDSQKTITVIHGDIGHGKTTILEAVYWCLYGESRSPNVDSDEGIINSDILHNLEIRDIEEAFVEVYLYEESDLRYKIKRTVEFTKKHESSDLVRDPTSCGRLPKGIDVNPKMSFSYLTQESDWEVINDIERIKNNINEMFPKSLSQYFLFDTELLDKFFEISDNKNIKVKDGIEKITGLPIIEKAIKDLHKTYDVIAKEIREANLDPIQNEKLLIERKIKKENELIDTETQKIKSYDSQIETIESFLRSYNEESIKSAQKNIDELKKDINENNKRQNKNNDEISIWLLRLNIRAMLHDSMKTSLGRCEDWEEKGEIPIAVSGLALKNILNAKHPICICGSDLNEGSEGRKYIEELLNKKRIESPIIQNITTGRSYWQDMVDEIDQAHDRLLKYRSARNELDYIHRDKTEKKKNLEKSIENVDIPEISQKSRKLKELRDNKQESLSTIKMSKRDLEQAEYNLEDVNRRFKMQLKKLGKYESQRNRMNLAKTLEQLFKKYKDELVIELRQTAAKKTTEYFLRLVSRKNDFSRVKIDENYKTVVLDRDGNTKDRSPGQDCCLALSYIAAIRDIAEKNYFMMIDSPLLKISQKERVDIAHNLPEFLPKTQITLLVQGQEYTGESKEKITGKTIPSVRKTLKGNDVVWREYVLTLKNEQDQASYTTVGEVKDE